MDFDAELFEAIVGGSSDGFCMAARGGDCVLANARLCELTGYSRDELLAMGVRDLFPAKHQDLIQGTLTRGCPGPWRGEVLCKDGSALPVDVTGHPVEMEGRHLALVIFRDITPVIAAETERATSEELFRTLFEQSNDAIFIHDLEGKFIRLNSKAMEIFGFTGDDPDHLTVKDLHPESELENSRRQFAKFLQEGSVRFETLFQRRDGTVFPAEVSSAIIHIDGRPLAQGIVRDLSALKALEQRYRGLFELSPVALWEEDFSGVKALIDRWRGEGVTDLDAFFTAHPEALLECSLQAKILDVNRAALALHGTTDKKVLLEGLDKIFTEESLTAFRQEIVGLASGKSGTEVQGRVRRMDGTSVDVIVNTFLMPGCQQDWKRAVVSEVDITRIKQLQRNLQEAQRLAKIGSWELDLASGDLWWSPEVYRIFEIDPAQFGASYEAFLAVIHPADRDAVDEAFSRHIKDDAPYDIVHRLLLEEPGGTERIKYVQEKCRTERDEQGRALRSLGTVQDVTARILAEQEKERQQQKMEHVQRLESLGVLAGGIAHDFNNLLTAIMGHASMGQGEAGSPDRMADHFHAIEETSRRAAELCRQMLAYSGKGKFLVQPLNLSELVEGMVRLLEVTLSKKVVVRYDLAPNLPAIKADRTQIQQIIMNLVFNANEALDNRSGNIMIATGLIQVDRDYMASLYLQGDRIKPGPHVFIEISDTGCGMDAATLEHLFEPFFTTKFTGRGLGMSAVQGIVRGHGGAIKVYSEVGKGTTFKVFFPAVDIPALPLADDEAGDSAAQEGTGLILVVDDEETIRNIAALALQRAGYRTVTACDGIEAVAMLKENAEEIVGVLLDMTMPRMGGEQAFTELARVKPGLKVILSSGYNEQTATQKLAGKGLAGFIQKPYSPRDLVAKVTQILR